MNIQRLQALKHIEVIGQEKIANEYLPMVQEILGVPARVVTEVKQIEHDLQNQVDQRLFTGYLFISGDWRSTYDAIIRAGVPTEHIISGIELKTFYQTQHYEMMKQRLSDLKCNTEKEYEVVVWGTGSAFVSAKAEFDRSMNLSISFFVDNNQNKWGTTFEGCEVKSPEALIVNQNDGDEKKDTYVFIFSQFSEAIQVQLKEFGVPTEFVFPYEWIQEFLNERSSELRRLSAINPTHTKVDIHAMYESYMRSFSNVTYRDIDLVHVFATRFCGYMDYRYQLEVHRFLPEPPKQLKFRLEGNGPIFATNLLTKREDIRELFNSHFKYLQEMTTFLISDVYDTYPETSELNELMFQPDPRSEEDTTSWNRTVRECLGKLNCLVSEEDAAWFCRWFAYFRSVVDYFYTLMENRSFVCYISINDVMAEENILTQICNLKGIRTYTLQHGYFPNTAAPEQVSSMSLVYYFNHAAHEFLIWGKGFEEHLEINGISRNVMHVLGNPKYDHTRDEFRRLFMRNQFAEKKIFTVIFVSPIFNEIAINQAMVRHAVEITKRFGMKFILKLHPFTKWSAYKHMDLEGCIEIVHTEETSLSVLKRSDFCILSNSTVFYEAILHQIVPFVYDDRQSHQFIDSSLGTYYSEELEIMKMLELLQSDAGYRGMQNAMERVAYQYFEVNEQRPSERYAQFFKPLLGGAGPND